MYAKENAPSCWRSIGAKKQDKFGKHPVPIITHPKPLYKRTRIKLVWTPVNVSLLILLAAILFIIIVNAITADPLKPELISMSDSVFRI